MALSIADQIALDDALVAPADRLRIGKCNLRLSSDVTSKEATLQVVYDVLKITPFYKAFQVTADAQRSPRLSQAQILWDEGTVLQTRGSPMLLIYDSERMIPCERSMSLYDENAQEDDDEHDDDKKADDDDDEELTESDEDGDEFVHPKLTTHDDEIIHEEDTDEDDSSISSSDEEDSDNDVEGVNVAKRKVTESVRNKLPQKLQAKQKSIARSALLYPSTVEQYLANKMQNCDFADQVKKEVSMIILKVEKFRNRSTSSLRFWCGSSRKPTHLNAVASNLSEILELKKILIDKMGKLTIYQQSQLKDLEIMGPYEVDEEPSAEQPGVPKEEGRREPPLLPVTPREKINNQDSRKRLSTRSSKQVSKMNKQRKRFNIFLIGFKDLRTTFPPDHCNGKYDLFLPFMKLSNLVQGKMKFSTSSRRRLSQTKESQDSKYAASLVDIQRRVEDLQLGVESYQKKLNLTKHDTDGTLDDVRTALNDRLKGIRMEYLPQTFWSQRDKANARAMIQAIDKRLKTKEG
ncbi:hypothetical protein Tco_0163453 [Tanacetum coccineum]